MPADKDYVLVVEDGVFMRQLLSSLLKQLGYEVVAVADGMEAISQMREVAPRLVLLDLEMPKLDGESVCRWMRRTPALKETPVIACSAHAEREKILGAMKSGMSDYLCKPVTRQSLEKRVRKHLSPESAAEAAGEP